MTKIKRSNEDNFLESKGVIEEIIEILPSNPAKGIESKIEKLESKVRKLESQVKTLKTKVKELESKV